MTAVAREYHRSLDEVMEMTLDQFWVCCHFSENAQQSTTHPRVSTKTVQNTDGSTSFGVSPDLAAQASAVYAKAAKNARKRAVH